MSREFFRSAAVAAALWLGGCSPVSDPAAAGSTQGTSASGGPSGSTTGTTGGTSSGAAGSTSSSGSSSASGSSGGPALATACGDGTPNNVDNNGDGLCDCLRIGTLGYAGTWGQGNVFSNWLSGRSVYQVVELKGQVLTADLLAPLDVLVVQDVRDDSPGQEGMGSGLGRSFSPDEVSALQAWVEGGGGVMTLTGYGANTEVANVNRLLAPFGLAYGTTNCLFGGGGTTPVTTWSTTHPIADHVTAIGVNNGYPVSGGTLVASQLENGQTERDMGMAVEQGKGHVFAWGDEWITYDSEWSSHPDYQVQLMWLNAFKWLTRAGYCQVPIPIPTRAN